jgi:hypothetical protein
LRMGARHPAELRYYEKPILRQIWVPVGSRVFWLRFARNVWMTQQLINQLQSSPHSYPALVRYQVLLPNHGI